MAYGTYLLPFKNGFAFIRQVFRQAVKLTGKEGIKRDYFILASGTMLAGAAAWDFWTHRIPNWWLGFWLVQILFPFFKTGGAELFQFLGNALLAAVITSILFYFRFIGAGDCKLMSLMCGYLGRIHYRSCMVIGKAVHLSADRTASFLLICLV